MRSRLVTARAGPYFSCRRAQHGTRMFDLAYRSNILGMKRTVIRHWMSEGSLVPPPRRQDVIEEPLDGEAVLFDPSNGSIHRLNQTALEVWRRCDGRATVEEIAQRQTELNDVEYDTALDFVEQVLALLVESKLLHFGDRP